MAYKLPKGDVEYYGHRHKRPIAYSTTATRDFIMCLADIYDGYTVNQLLDELNDRTKWLRNQEAIDVLEAYKKKGYGKYVFEGRGK